MHASYSVIDLAPPTIGSVHLFQPVSTLLVKGPAMPRLLEIWRRGKVQTGKSVLGVQYVLSNSLPIGLVVEVDYYRYCTIKN